MQSASFIGGLKKVTGKWCKQRKREERDASARSNRRYVMLCRRRVTLKDAAFSVMERAYMKASGNGRLPAHARQIMYAARGEILKLTDKDTLDDQYFTQTLLPQYVAEYDVDWDIVYDARGHFQEPHAGGMKDKSVALGTIGVRNYLREVSAHTVTSPSPRVDQSQYPTFGPQDRFGAVLFIEKEGFLPLLEEVRLAERFDLAIMSTKGVSNIASRQLVDDLCCQHKIPLLVLHDFDADGFKILGSLQQSNHRFQFSGSFDVIDLGLRLKDVEENGLESEAHCHSRDLTGSLRRYGVTDEEIEFLQHDRVELNAFGSEELVAWLEAKLEDHNVRKVIPDGPTLSGAFQRAVEVAQIEKAITAAAHKAHETAAAVEIPVDLSREIEARLENDPELSWDDVIEEIVREELEEQSKE